MAIAYTYLSLILKNNSKKINGSKNHKGLFLCSQLLPTILDSDSDLDQDYMTSSFEGNFQEDHSAEEVDTMFLCAGQALMDSQELDTSYIYV